MNVSDFFGKLPSIGRVLIIQLGDIGDVVWTLPALAAIRKAWPGVELSVLLRAGSASLLDAEILPPKTFEVPQSGKSLVKDIISSFSLISSLRREHFDLVFDFRADERGGTWPF